MVHKSSLREEFNTVTALKIADGRWGEVPSKKFTHRFAYLVDDAWLTIIAGSQEDEDVQRALAVGLSYRDGRALRLVLPSTHLHATKVRMGWLRPQTQVELWQHDGQRTKQVPRASKATLLKLLEDVRWPRPTPALSTWSGELSLLVAWIDKHEHVDPAHRQSYRSWQCRGRTVLKIERRANDLTVTAGVSSPSPQYTSRVVQLARGELLPDVPGIQALIDRGIDQRMNDKAERMTEPEHWLQAVLRREPERLSLAEPVIREMPAWRPRSEADKKGKLWGRGYLDLVGLDSLGTVHLVETKIKPDDLLVLQGLDYYIWSLAKSNDLKLRERLDVDHHAGRVIDFVIGGTVDATGVVGQAKVSRHTRAQVDALDESCAWRFHEARAWFPGTKCEIKTLNLGAIPSIGKDPDEDPSD